jgi:hypothetical protein
MPKKMGTYHGPWYDIDIVAAQRQDEAFELVADLDSYKITTRRHWGYWWHMARAAWKLGKEAIVRRLKSN